MHRALKTDETESTACT